MEWVLRSPQIHSTFSNLGYAHADGYYINDNCNAALETILHNVLTEDKYLRSYRRNISFGQNIKKDLIPLLIHAKEDKTIELLIKIFVNLTTPVECLFNVEDISKSDFGRHTVFEINNLLASTKAALTDHRTTKVIVDFLKKNSEFEQKVTLPLDQCGNIINTLVFLRNILHIPDDVNSLNPTYTGPTHTIQNQILWNLFSQSIDKVLIKLMTITDSATWGVTMVQLIALLYKDQHVTTLHKLLNVWLETSLSESSEDNESNTTPPDRGSGDSSPMLMSDPTSDSSDTGGSGKCNGGANLVNNAWPGQTPRNNATDNGNQPTRAQYTDKKVEIIEKMDYSDDASSKKIVNAKPKKTPQNNGNSEKPPQTQTKVQKKNVVADNSDCGYGTQIENQESISTSSNEDELPAKKPVHQKPHTAKQRVSNKTRPNVTAQERKRKKIVKRGKSNIINVQGLSHNTPTDDDISNVLKEFTVDFLLKGFNSLVRTLHNQILTNHQLKIDTSHFFWLVTYFMKFATQIELDIEHVSSVLSYDIVSYLTAEGVNICEQFELSIKLDGNDLKPSIRRLHLVVTAIREFVQAIQAYKKTAHMSNDDQQVLVDLQMKMCETEELRSLLVLLLRHYNPKYHSKQYLQDLVVTNHILLMFLDGLMKLPEYNGPNNMVDHIKQFATSDIMYQYGLLLEDYEENGEFVNDCIFTMMHHVGGELGSLMTLFQPKILKTFTSIWKSEFEICDDWTDLVEYVINTFVKKPHSLHNSASFRLEPEDFDNEDLFRQLKARGAVIPGQEPEEVHKRKSVSSKTSSKDRWSEDEISALSWKFMQCNASSDMIGEIVKLFKEDGIYKTRASVARELLKQMLINKDEFDKHVKDTDRNSGVVQVKKDTRDSEIGKLCGQIANDGKAKFLDWVQTVLLETCNVKIYQQKKIASSLSEASAPKKGVWVEFDRMVTKRNDLPAMSPVSYHALLFNQSVPLVPWNCEQAAICKDLKFLQVLHKLGFHMPVDTGKVFIRIPHFWTPDFLYEVAAKISPIDASKLKFSLNDISESSIMSSPHQSIFNVSMDLSKDSHLNIPPDNFYQVHKQKHLATLLNYTPMPGSSLNTSVNDIDTPNWLEMVQKSQEYNLNLNIHRSIVVEQDNIQSVSVTQLVTAAAIPAIMSVKQETSNYSIHQIDSEYNNSVCETASVASDLTRMYVSDEDEKDALSVSALEPLELLDDPLAAPLAAPLALDPTRLTFSPPFDSQRSIPELY
ncbi:protein timeless isoform X2 [Epargyreus clarus]|uniref:protein timeless isoform X2 n=1 Tax=Epargyreus clarus TaxID=520877 RepID=UPI003C2FCF10